LKESPDKDERSQTATQVSSVPTRRHPRTYKQLFVPPQSDILNIDFFFLIRKIDLEGKGYVDQATIISAVQKDGEASNYDEIRATLREVNIDASGRVELEDYVEV